MVIAGSDDEELMDVLNPSSVSKLDSSLLLSNYLQQSGSMEWIMYKSR